MFFDAPQEEPCPRCHRCVTILAIEPPATQSSECKEPGCPMNAKYLQRAPEFPDPDVPYFVHQLTFVDDDGSET